MNHIHCALWLDNSILRLQDIADIAVWERFGMAAEHLAGQRINLDGNPRSKQKRECIQKIFMSTRPILKALLENGTQLFNEQQQQHDKDWLCTWTTAYAQACSLYCSSCKAIGYIVTGSTEFKRLVKRCLATTEFLLDMPLRVQREAGGKKRRMQRTCSDAEAGTPFTDNCTSMMKLHGHMVAQEVVISLREDNLAPVPQKVYDDMVSGNVTSSERSLDINVALDRLKVQPLRHRLEGALEKLRCAIDVLTWTDLLHVSILI
jgi:hypothetical protein